jgi:hypothetical protein
MKNHEARAMAPARKITTMRKHVRTRRDGFALMIVILGTLVLSGLTLAALKLGTDEASAARATRVSASALYAAETGVRATQLAWPKTAMTALAAGDSICLDGACSTGWTTFGNGSAYRRVIHRRDAGTNANNRMFSLTAGGKTFGPLGGEATVQTWVTMQPATGTSKFVAAISAVGQIKLSGNDPGSYTDSYDSRLGDYNALLAGGSRNVEASGDVVAGGQLSMSGMASIRGSANVNSYDGGGTVTGDVVTGAESPDHPVEKCPLGTLSLSPSTSAWKYDAKTASGSFNLGGGTYTFASGTYSMAQFTVGGGATVIIPAGAVVNIYLSDRLLIGGGATINNQGRNSSALNFISCYKTKIDAKTGAVITTYNTTGWDLAGYSASYLTIYAPTNKVTLGGESPLYGAVVADQFESTGSAPVHFDRALKGSASTETAIKIASRSWSQPLR